MKKRTPITMPAVPLAAIPASNRADLLDRIRHEEPATSRALVSLKPHPNPSRPLDPRHILDMARSIAALGLIHPIVIDLHDVVLAGSHRYAALCLLAEPPDKRHDFLCTLCPLIKNAVSDQLAPIIDSLPTHSPAVTFSAIPCRIMPLSLTEDPEAAWRVEVAENERRRDYKAGEVKVISERLRQQGYRLERGRPATGEQAGMPVLTALIGKSESTVRRMLAAAENPSSDRNQFEKDRMFALRALTRFKTKHKGEISAENHQSLDEILQVLDRMAE